MSVIYDILSCSDKASGRSLAFLDNEKTSAYIINMAVKKRLC